MKRYHKSISVPAGPITDFAEQTRRIHDLLPHLAMAMVANEKVQRKFRTAVLIRLAKIETMASMIHGAQIADAHQRNPHYDEEKLPMTEFVREDRDTEFASGVSDGPLNIGLVHPVADFTVGAWMEAGE